MNVWRTVLAVMVGRNHVTTVKDREESSVACAKDMANSNAPFSSLLNCKCHNSNAISVMHLVELNEMLSCCRTLVAMSYLDSTTWY